MKGEEVDKSRDLAASELSEASLTDSSARSATPQQAVCTSFRTLPMHEYLHERTLESIDDFYTLYIVQSAQTIVAECEGSKCTLQSPCLILTSSHRPISIAYADTEARPVDDYVFVAPQRLFYLSWLDLPEVRPLVTLMENARNGLSFAGKALCATAMVAVVRPSDTTALRRLMSVYGLFAELSECPSPPSMLFATETHEPLPLASVYSPGKHSGTMMMIHTYMEEHYDKKMTLDELASLTSMSRSGLCRYYKSATGMTLSDRLAQIRASKACRLLTDTTLNIERIAYMTGYANQSQFIRRFAEIYGITPARYRRLNRHMPEERL